MARPGPSIMRSMQQRKGKVGQRPWAKLGGASAYPSQAAPGVPPGGDIGLAVGLEIFLMPKVTDEGKDVGTA